MVSNLNEAITKIKSKGYWQLIVEPTKLISNKFFKNPIEAKEYIDKNKIELRGWDYPHLPVNSTLDKFVIDNEKGSGFVDWNHYVEAWSYFQSGQFIHLLGLREDWFEQSDWFDSESIYKKTESKTVLDFASVGYTLTEMMLFIKNISINKFYSDKVKIHISLHNINNRKIFTFDQNRCPLFWDYRCEAPELSIIDDVFDVTYINENALSMAVDMSVDLFKYFDWPNPPIEVIKKDQEKLLTRTI